ncbi:MAG: PA2169 family four-helix-bundle protein [Acidobacteriota bacterium]
MDSKETITQLSNLIQTCRDAHEGFRLAAQVASNNEIKTFLTGLSARRTGFVADLAPHVRALNVNPEKELSLSSTLRRAWLEAKNNFSNKDDRSLLAEVGKAEDYVITVYENALKTSLPVAVRPVVEQQLNNIRETRSHLAQMQTAKSVAGK